MKNAMTNYKLAFFFNIIILFEIGCTNAQQQNVEKPLQNKKYYRAQEGGSILIDIDQETSLDILIKKLNTNWELSETGKGYWIGYTDEMFSIAAYEDKAIKPLLDFFYATNSPKGKTGVIYCLHLVGINGEIVGRFHEKFINKLAREALLNLANNKEYAPLIVSLLARDPWHSDLKTLSKLLKVDSTNLQLINALFRYTGEDFPFRQNISESFDTINVLLKDSTGVTVIGKLTTVYRESEKDNGNKGNSLKNLVVQWSVSTGRIFRKFNISSTTIKKVQTYFECSEKQLVNSTCEELNGLLYNLFLLSTEKVSEFSYCVLNDRFHHYVEGNNLIICTAQQTRQRWLAYFKTKAL